MPSLLDEYGSNMLIVTTGPNGEVILIDPIGAAVHAAVNQHNCKTVFEGSMDRVEHFVGRMRALGKGPEDVVIVLLSMDDPTAAILGDLLMPNMDWQGIRDAGQVPFARGLASREGIQLFLNEVNPAAGESLHLCNDVAVLVMDFNEAAIFPVPW